VLLQKALIFIRNDAYLRKDLTLMLLIYLFDMEFPSDLELDVDDEYKEIYRKNYRTIRTRTERGRFRTVYHFLVTSDYSRAKAKDFIAAVDFQFIPQNSYKVNAAFGFILRNIRTNELRFFHPSNNIRLYETPAVVADRKDIVKFLDDLESEDARAYAYAHRPSTAWRVAKIVCVRFDIYKTNLRQF